MDFLGPVKKKRKPLSHPKPIAVQSMDPGPALSIHIQQKLRSFAIVMVSIFLLAHCTLQSGTTAVAHVNNHAAD